VLPDEIAWTPALVAEVRANEQRGDDHLAWDPSVAFAVLGIELLNALGHAWARKEGDIALAQLVTRFSRGEEVVDSDTVNDVRERLAADPGADLGSPWLEYVGFGVSLLARLR
jgi:hypothetical protein